MAIQRVAEVSGYSSGRCVSKVGMLSGMPVLTREKLGATGLESVRARCLEACLGVTAGVMAEAKRCYSCESSHETTSPVGENQDKQGEEVYY